MNDIPVVTSPRVLCALFTKYGLVPRRYLGQNFLIDANIARKIVSCLQLNTSDAVIEVGPGAGALTVLLARTGVRLLALEIDRGLVRLLEDVLKMWPLAEVLEKDVLTVDWKDLTREMKKYKNSVKLVSNLPYKISAPFMYSLLETGFPFDCAVLMFQKEFAGRLVAVPGDADYGSLSVLCRYYTESEIIHEVSKNVFWPRPGVDSAIIRLKVRNRSLNDAEEAVLWKIVRGVFQQRRKTIVKSLGRVFPFSRDRLESLLKASLVSPTSRPEELDEDQFALLARITYNYINNC